MLFEMTDAGKLFCNNGDESLIKFMILYATCIEVVERLGFS